MTPGIPTFMKWAGGKGSLLSQYEKFFPKRFNRYFEPFVGSGAVYFHLKLTRRISEAFLSDSNPDLINVYGVVRHHPEELIIKLSEHEKKHEKTYYYYVRGLNVADLSRIEQAARLIYLNRTCFNGLYRVNARGGFNVPIGEFKHPSIVRAEVIRQASKLLSDAHLSVGDFTAVLDHAKAGDFVYFDPPYYPLSKTSSFTSYQIDKFGESEHRCLAEVFRKLDERGCYVMLSNSSAQFILDLYSDYVPGGMLYPISAHRAISADASKRGKVTEILVVNYALKPKEA